MTSALVPAVALLPAGITTIGALVLVVWGAPRLEANRKPAVQAGMATKVSRALFAAAIVLDAVVIVWVAVGAHVSSTSTGVVSLVGVVVAGLFLLSFVPWLVLVRIALIR
ncbi:hypothetical protein QDT91_29435 (plasmid) [Mycolicibacterium aubagnense]|jgi:hypothetical protein|uniref:hypothetical protein n=1 Tax=Mycolicibacterium aubagnense TaxID=319707 RepID=UPI0013F65A80|nr:hypothetical protein [Mycolicibacterium aubagnense]MBN9635596.1 hypothetical protein [Actinomycetota bacterium]WGI36141.1 hypothetical protein QDT91_29435 [Mycolicibacterium aubagnense]